MTVRTREITLEGAEELRHMSDRVSPRQASNIARGTVQKIAGDARGAMRRRAPKDDGTLRRAIIAKRRRGTPTMAVSDVRITHGSGVKHDAWYWHFIEFGTVKHPPTPFIIPTVEEMQPELVPTYRREFGKRLEKMLEREHKKQQVRK